MRAVVLEGVGGPEQLAVREVPEPVAAEGQVLVDVRAAGINFADVLIRLGNYPQMPDMPAVLGSEECTADERHVVCRDGDGLRIWAYRI